MFVTLGYGKTQLTVEVPDESCIGVLMPSDTQNAEVQSALANPIGSPALAKIVHPGETVAIVTSDITRPVPSHLILPHVLRELNGAGIPDCAITVVLALGSHRKHTETEQRKLLGEALYGRVACVDSDDAQCIPVGTTSRGTPVELFAPVVRADRRICVGNIEYHYFAGYSGGAKALLPGVASRRTIQANHSMMMREEACAGCIEGNPVRADIDEALRFAPVDFIVNAVLDDRKRILRIFAGDPLAAHRAGCRYLDGIYKVPPPSRADIVIASPGGHPKDINLYQAQKALDNAALAVRDGGILILAASCAEGFGEPTFECWMRTMEPADMICAIRRRFVLGGHKAAAIAAALQRMQVFIVCDLEREILQRLPFTPFGSLEEALAEAMARLGPHARTLVMPAAASTLPMPI